MSDYHSAQHSRDTETLAVQVAHLAKLLQAQAVQAYSAWQQRLYRKMQQLATQKTFSVPLARTAVKLAHVCELAFRWCALCTRELSRVCETCFGVGPLHTLVRGSQLSFQWIQSSACELCDLGPCSRKHSSAASKQTANALCSIDGSSMVSHAGMLPVNSRVNKETQQCHVSLLSASPPGQRLRVQEHC